MGESKLVTRGDKEKHMTQEQTEAGEELARRLSSHEFMTQAIQKAINDAVLDHKNAGNPIAVWRNGGVVIVPPEDITLDGETP